MSRTWSAAAGIGRWLEDRGWERGGAEAVVFAVGRLGADPHGRAQLAGLLDLLASAQDDDLLHNGAVVAVRAAAELPAGIDADTRASAREATAEFLSAWAAFGSVRRRDLLDGERTAPAAAAADARQALGLTDGFSVAGSAPVRWDEVARDAARFAALLSTTSPDAAELLDHLRLAPKHVRDALLERLRSQPGPVTDDALKAIKELAGGRHDRRDVALACMAAHLSARLHAQAILLDALTRPELAGDVVCAVLDDAGLRRELLAIADRLPADRHVVDALRACASAGGHFDDVWLTTALSRLQPGGVNDAVTEPVVAALRSGDPATADVLRALARGSAAGADPRTMDATLAIAGARETAHRPLAVSALQGLAGAAVNVTVIDLLERLVCDPDPLLSLRATEVMAAIELAPLRDETRGELWSALELTQSMPPESAAEVQRVVAPVLGRAEPDRLIAWELEHDVLRELLRDALAASAAPFANPDVRSTLLRHLSSIDPRRVSTACSWCVALRAHVVHDVEVLHGIERHVLEGEPTRRMLAVAALAEIGGQPAAEIVARVVPSLARDDDPGLRLTALTAASDLLRQGLRVTRAGELRRLS